MTAAHPHTPFQCFFFFFFLVCVCVCVCFVLFCFFILHDYHDINHVNIIFSVFVGL